MRLPGGRPTYRYGPTDRRPSHESPSPKVANGEDRGEGMAGGSAPGVNLTSPPWSTRGPEVSQPPAPVWIDDRPEPLDRTSDHGHIRPIGYLVADTFPNGRDAAPGGRRQGAT